MSITKSYTFTNNTVIDPTEVNQNFDDLVASIKAAHHSDADGTKILPADINASWGLVPLGGIILWSGTIANIPAGYGFCNGSSETIDLRNKFVLCAGQDSGGTYDTGDTGGEVDHTLTEAEMPSHDHGISASNDTSTNVNRYARGGSAAATDHTQNAGSGNAHNNMPPYKALAYIQKV
jgi:hypothetical protein